MTDYMESEQTTLVTVKLIEAVGALTDVELDCLAQVLHLTTQQTLVVRYAALLSYNTNYNNTRTLVSKEPSERRLMRDAIRECGIDEMNYIACVATRLIAYNCWIQEYDNDLLVFKEAGIADERLFDFELDRDCMSWKNDKDAVIAILHKLLPEIQ